jgi:hypothetical protein
MTMLGGYLFYKSNSQEEMEQWPLYLFVSAAVGSMVYVRCIYYPWLVAKKKDPVLPRHASTEEPPTPRPTLTFLTGHPLEISLI